MSDANNIPGGNADDAIPDDWAAALAEQKSSADGGGGRAQADTVRPMQPEDFSDIKTEPPSDVNLEMVLDVPVTISMEIGRTRIPIRNLLQLNQGSVVELDRLAGEPLDVLVNGTLIAHGEVVVVNEKFGIRLTDVISPSERIRKLR
ncbi:flagellar motor switch protein FliN [Caldichromatium japonicum]|uniref:Flagellar motor switch protein FliN n=1 Tax=Caldichromatium japonicum TaxID=2699430 RepID=A0A6G7VGC1_9GAMM|nr:flagellar motor switch protein FliN [Caldichromatium japonicum]QIK38926.1 flagellar motor switch protein FliN [Caldichromatium japonicum]